MDRGILSADLSTLISTYLGKSCRGLYTRRTRDVARSRPFHNRLKAFCNGIRARYRAFDKRRTWSTFSCCGCQSQTDEHTDSTMWLLIDRSSVESYEESLGLLNDVLSDKGDPCAVLYVAVPEVDDEAEPTLQTLDVLYNVLLPIALRQPTLRVIPIFEFLYKGKNISPMTPDEKVLCGELTPQSGGFQRMMQSCVQIPSLQRVQSPSAVKPICTSRIILPLAPSSSNAWSRDKDSLRFKNVAVGGTFDRFHAGHRLLLGATAMVTTEKVFIGITSDKLLQNKKAKELLQSYEERCDCAVRFIQAVNPTLALVSAGPLTDPRIPPLCATEENFDAIVVSEETIEGAQEINRVRAELGFHPLIIIVVGLLSAAAGEDSKLSSSALRVQEQQHQK